MNNELGIEMCCKNCCWNRYKRCNGSNGDRCISNNYKMFCPSPFAYEVRIKELQKVMREEADAIDLGVSALNKHYEEQIQRLKEQKFTIKELRLMECLVRVYIMIHKISDDEATSKTLLKKIEQSLKNSEANLKEQEQTTEKVF